jgi:beta-lactamase regulating signal transducer with metallopeptidase domain
MNVFTQLFTDVLPNGVVERTGWTLLHSVWQFALFGVLLVVAERLLAQRSASTKYLAASTVLCSMAGLSLVTFLVVDVEPALQASVGVSDSTSKAESPPLGFNGYVLDNGRLHAMYIGGKSITPHEWDELPEPPAEDRATLPADVPVHSESRQAETPLAGIAKHVRPWLPVCVGGWLIGMAVTALRLVAGAFNVCRLRRSGRTMVSEDVQALLAATAKRLGVRRAVEIATSSLVNGPIVIGWLKPLILLPVTSLTGLTTEQLEAVLAHELAHIRRFDFLVNLLQTIVETVFFYHPAVWWVSRRMRIHREDCCDDQAVSVVATRVAYASALLKLYELQGGARVPDSGMVLSATGGSLKKRIHRVLGLDCGSQSAPVWWCSLTIVGAIVLVAGCGLLADDAQAKREQEQQEREEILAKAKGMSPPVPNEKTGLLPSANTPEEREQVLQQLDSLGVSRSRVLGITPDRGPGAKPFQARLRDMPDEAWPLLGQLVPIRKMSMTACQTSPEAFRHIAGLRMLDHLTVMNSRFEPEHLAALAALPRLQELDAALTVLRSEFDRKAKLGQLSAAEQQRFDEIAGPDLRKEKVAEAAILTDRAMTKLAGLTRLRKLRLSNTFVTNFGMKALANMQELRQAEITVLGQTSLATTEMLSSIPNLEELHLISNIDAAAASGLQTAPKLQKLELRSIDDNVARIIAEIPTLEWLCLLANSLSDDGLLEIAKLPKLRHIDLRNGYSGTVTLAGIQRFQDARPGCEVLHDFVVETLEERRIALPDDHFLVCVHWHDATTRDHLTEEMQKRFSDSTHLVEVRPLTRSGYVGGIALLKGEAGRDWFVKRLEQDDKFDVRFAEPLTYERLKTEGVMFESLLKVRQEKAREYDAKRRAELVRNTHAASEKASLAASVIAPDEPLPPLEELSDRLREQGHEEVAEWLSGRYEYLTKRVQDETTGVIAYGQVVAPRGESPRYCDAQMTILDGGWFVDIIGDKDRPVAFRMSGCRPVDVVPSRVQPDVEARQTLSLGRIVMEPYPTEELATVRGRLKFEGETPPDGIRVRVIIKSGRANSETGGTDGFLEWPEKENVTLSEDLQFEHRQLAPVPHRLQIESLGFRAVARDVEPGAGATLDLGVIEIPKSVRLKVEVLAAANRDFSQSERRVVTVHLRQTWRAAPFLNPKLAEYPGGDMMFRLRRVDSQNPDSKERVHFASGVASLKVAHLGDGELDDFVDQSTDSPKLLRDRQVPIESGHVYLTYHSHWKHWTLARVTIE